MLSQKDPLPFVGPGAEISVSDSGLNWDGRRLSPYFYPSGRSKESLTALGLDQSFLFHPQVDSFN